MYTRDALGRAAGSKDGPCLRSLEPKRLQRGVHKAFVCPTPGSGTKAEVFVYILAFAYIILGGGCARFLNLDQMKAIPWVSGSGAALGACGWVTPYNYTSVEKAPEPRMLVGGGCLASHLLSPTWL